MAYLAQQVAPKVAGQLSGSLGIENQILNQAITQGTVGAGMSALAGGSGTEGFTAGAIGGAIGGGIDMVQPEFKNFVIDELGIPKEYAGVVTNTLTSLMPTILTGGQIDPTKVLMNYMLRAALSGAKTQPTTNTTETTQTADSGLQSLMIGDTNPPPESIAMFPKDVQDWIDEAESASGKRYRASVAARYGFMEEPTPDTEFVPNSYRNSMFKTPFDPNIGQYMIEQGDNMVVRPEEYGGKVGSDAFKERLGTKYIDI